jgi:hypothetical protein
LFSGCECRVYVRFHCDSKSRTCLGVLIYLRMSGPVLACLGNSGPVWPCLGLFGLVSMGL